METVRLSDEDKELLNKYMANKKIKSKSEAIRKCIRKTVKEQNINDLIFDLNNKMNRILHNQYLTKKLLEQLYVNMGFKKNLDTKNNVGLKDFNEKFNSYIEKFLE